MKILIACEESGIVREAFAKKGHDAISCDILPSRLPGKHHQGFLEDFIGRGDEWDLIIAFPPCTHLSSSGARWFKDKVQEQAFALAFVQMIWRRQCPKICIENPIGILSRKENLGKPSQIIQPWQFGHGETKATCLWLKGLPPLVSTNVVEGREQRVWKMPPSPDRAKERSKTFQGIASGMAAQWG